MQSHGDNKWWSWNLISFLICLVYKGRKKSDSEIMMTFISTTVGQNPLEEME